MPPFTKRLRRVLAIIAVAAGFTAPALVPSAALADYAWGAVQVQGCAWAGMLPRICGSLDVHSNGTDFNYGSGDTGWGTRWQCVELVQRWANLAYGETYDGNSHWPVWGAFQMWDVWRPGNTAQQSRFSVPFYQHPNGGSSAPMFGDLMVFAPTSADPYGHVAVVSGLERGYVDVVEQNWSSSAGFARLPMWGSSVLDRGQYRVYGWLRAANAATFRSLAQTPGHTWSATASDGTIQASLLGTDSATWYTRGSGANFTGPATYGGAWASPPTAVQDSAGRVELFVTGADHSVGRFVPTAVGSTSGTWTGLGGTTPGRPAAVRAPDGHLEVFIRALDGAYWRNYELTAGGRWAGWTSLGGILLTDPAVVIGTKGKLDVFGIGTDHSLWWWSRTGNSQGTWSGLGGVSLGAPEAMPLPSGDLTVFLTGTDNAIWSKQQGAGGWTEWGSLGGIVLGDPTVVKDPAGNPEVLVVGTDHGVWVDRGSAAGWSGWSGGGGALISDVSAARDNAGNLEVFAVGRDHDLVYAVERAPGGALGSWRSLGGRWLLP